MTICERLSQKTSNAPIVGAYNIENVNEVIGNNADILHSILKLKNINDDDVDFWDWFHACEIIGYAIHNVRATQPHAVLSFWLDD